MLFPLMHAQRPPLGSRKLTLITVIAHPLVYGLLVLLEGGSQGGHKFAHITGILDALVVELLVLAQIVGSVPHIGTLITEVLDPLVERLLVPPQAAGRARLEVALVAGVADPLVYRLLMEPQRDSRFQNVAADFTGVLAAPVLEALVCTECIGLVRDKVAEVAVERHLDVSLVVDFKVVLGPGGKLALVTVELKIGRCTVI